MTAGVTEPKGFIATLLQALYKTVQRQVWLVALLALVTALGAEPWRAPLHCQSDALCAATSDDTAVATGNSAAVVDLADDAWSDDPSDPSDQDVHKFAAAVELRPMAVQAAVVAVVSVPRRWQILFPDKTGPPRA